MLYWRSPFNISTEKFDLEWNHVSGVKFAESCRAGGKWAYEEYLQNKFIKYFDK